MYCHVFCEAVYEVHVGLDLMREFGFTSRVREKWRQCGTTCVACKTQRPLDKSNSLSECFFEKQLLLDEQFCKPYPVAHVKKIMVGQLLI